MRRPRLKALLLEGMHPDAVRALRGAGFSVEARPGALEGAGLARALKGASVLGIRSQSRVSMAALAGARDLLAVGCFCVGTEKVDLDACADRGVAVFNAPYSNTRSVAELVAGEVVMLMRRVFERSSRLHRGVWEKSASGSHEVRGKTLGIIGYGNIGSQVGILAEALGMRVLYYDIKEKLSVGNARRARSMEEALRSSDAVTVHVDDQPRNAGLVGDRELAMLKPGSVFLNSSRGRVVDIAALAGRLRSGRLAGAAVDVFPNEPGRAGGRFRSPLLGLPNVILTPHIGGSTVEAQRNIAAYVCERLARYLRTGDSLYSVNMPEVQLPVLKGQHRVLHIHRNVPGVMSQINTVMASRGINITGQYLETNSRVGYAITDIGSSYPPEVLKELSGVTATIRLRVLY